MSDPTGHQNHQGFPRLDSPAIDLETGFWTPPWYRLLISLWQKAGGSFSRSNEDTFGQQQPDGGSEVFLFNSMTGAPISAVPVAFQRIPQDLPTDLPSESDQDSRRALMLAVPADQLDPDQIVLAALARAIPSDI